MVDYIIKIACIIHRLASADTKYKLALMIIIYYMVVRVD